MWTLAQQQLFWNIIPRKCQSPQRSTFLGSVSQDENLSTGSQKQARVALMLIWEVDDRMRRLT